VMYPSDLQLRCLKFQSVVAFALFLFVLYFQLAEDIGHICATERGMTRKDVSEHDGPSFILAETAATLFLTHQQQS
jgi:hypothetical protein